jgi:type IV pilus assembly protein PilY1
MLSIDGQILRNARNVALATMAFYCAVYLPSYAQDFKPVQQPSATAGVPGNLLLALSVEFPTGLQVSYTSGTYSFSASVTDRYQGYFDNRKCYSYSTTDEVFAPSGAISSTGACLDNTQWSGDVLNWLTMTNLDQFRSTMTGGTRDVFSSMASTSPGDTAASTILIRSFSDRDAYSVVKTLPSSALGVPTSPTDLTGNIARSGGYGSKFLVRGDNTFGEMDAAEQRRTCASTTLAAGTSCFHIRVAACTVAGTGLEANCKTGYSGVAKPEGLVQEYANKMRFGAFGYLNQSSNDRNGAVLRSAMKSVGPTAVTATTTVANAAKEWDETTGIMYPNPDSADATASDVVNSGLMNYLNKFGYAAGYKGLDPVGELYYAAQLYLRGLVPPTEYADLSGATVTQAAEYKDGFPVITGTNLRRGQNRDPIIQSCQKNFILGLGDIYTHCDGNLPGSLLSDCAGGAPADPEGLDVSAQWDKVTALEGSTAWVGGSSNATPYIAGLAYWANTNDIRSDLQGTQTISTYWVDVLENTNGQSSVAAASLVKSQFWLATKYGGFDTAKNTVTDPNINPNSWDASISPSTVGDGIPNTWFAGSTPTLLKQGLSRAFSSIAAASSGGSAGGAAASAPLQTNTSQTIYTGYDPKSWTGTLRSCLATQTPQQCNDSPQWESSKWFKTSSPTFVATPLTEISRKIFTSASSPTFTTTVFNWANLSTAQQAALNGADTKGAERTAYLRGNKTDEGTLFRFRKDSLLGDIVNSGVRYLQGSEAVYSGPNFVGHAAYRATNRARPAVAYVGANDGMLHAFNATDGKELFGYVPGAVFLNLPGLTASAFEHKYFVDSTPMVGDVQNGSNWNTILSGGLGGGGKGYFALNITNQSTFESASQATLSTLPIWEFTDQQDADLGFTFNEPSIDPISGASRQIAKVASSSVATGVWRTIVGNGFGSTAGKSALFMLDALSGTVANKIVADSGPANGLATPTPFDTDRDGLVDTIYAGDLSGKMHKFQFSKLLSGSYVVAASGDSSAQWRYIGVVFDSGQPITTAPSVARSCDGSDTIVAFGSGKFNETSDLQDTAPRGFYAVKDSKPSTSPLVTAAELGSITFTTTTTNAATVRNWVTPNLTGKLGWYMSYSGGERVLSNSTLPPDTGGVLIGTTKPVGDFCTPGNIGFTMLVDLCTGKATGLLIDGVGYGGVGTGSLGDGIHKISNTVSNTQNRQVVIGNQGPTGLTALSGSAPKGRYSWREIPNK